MHRFRSKYHPDEASRLKAEARSALHNRLNVFTFLMENGWFDHVSLDIEQSPVIIRVLDAGESSGRITATCGVEAFLHSDANLFCLCSTFICFSSVKVQEIWKVGLQVTKVNLFGITLPYNCMSTSFIHEGCCTQISLDRGGKELS